MELRVLEVGGEENQMIERIKYYRDGARVRRYHTLDLLVGETVGHHSCNVALIVSTIVPYPSANLLLAALKHDLAEQHTGDVPATAKWDNPLLKRLLDRVEGQHVEEHDEHVLTLSEKQALKQADMLDLCFKCLEEINMGNASMERVLHNGLQWLNDNDPLPTTFTLIKEIENEYYR